MIRSVRVSPLSAWVLALVAQGGIAVGLCAQVPLDLRSWTAESYPAVSGFDNGRWTVSGDGTSVTQSANGQPTLFYSPFDVMSLRIDGRIRVGTSGDNDYIGFVIGVRPGDPANPAAEYLLIDWKRGTQLYDFGAPSCTPGSTADRGLAVSHVHGIPTADEFWGHVNLDTAPCSGPSDRVDELARATNLGDSGWVNQTDYAFTFVFDPSRLEVWVDGVLEIAVSGVFPIGRFGFYNFSQGTVTYSAFQAGCTASTVNYGLGYAGSLGVPGLGSSLPQIGTTLSIVGGNAAGVPCAGVLLYGFAPADLDSGFLGRILVEPFLLEGLAFPVEGMTKLLGIPNDLTFCGGRLYLQALHLDAGAGAGLAFSPGLRLVIGT